MTKEPDLRQKNFTPIPREVESSKQRITFEYNDDPKLSKYAIIVFRLRNKLIIYEFDKFHLHSSISVGILSCIATSGGVCEVEEIYRFAQSTESSVRRHLNLMMKVGLIKRVKVDEDLRKNCFALTEKGVDACEHYAADIGQMLSKTVHEMNELFTDY